MNNMLKRSQAGLGLFLASVLSMVAPSAMAVTDYSAITSAVDWSAVGTAVITVLAAGAAIIVAFKGGKMLLSAIRGA